MKKLSSLILIILFLASIKLTAQSTSYSDEDNRNQQRREATRSQDSREANRQDAADPIRRAAGYYGVSRKAYRSRNYQRAYDYIKKAIRYNPNKAKYRYNLGLCAEKLGLYRDALNAFRKARELDPNISFTRRSVFEKRLQRIRERAEQGSEPQRYERNRNYREGESRQENRTIKKKTDLKTIIGYSLLGIAGLLLLIYLLKKFKKN